MTKEYSAHIIPENGREQKLIDHLENTAERAKSFAEGFGAGEIAERCGMLHDVGKYSDAFQRRIRGENIRVDHSTAGTQEAYRLGDIPASFAIAGHHAGIPDKGGKTDTPEESTLFGRIKRRAGAEIEGYSAFGKEIEVNGNVPRRKFGSEREAFFFTHMLFSCLVDADWLDTEDFMKQGLTERGTGQSLEILGEKLKKFIVRWKGSENPINIRRNEILGELINAGSRERGLYTLTVPTGGGKTVGSVAFALEHAVKNGQKRIIYVIPYTSIIEQTQKVFENIFGGENVIAHYSDVSYGTDEQGDLSERDRRRYLASENWDAPVILTTAVQFFESLFGNRPSANRKLHNIAESVIIFDEAQMLPTDLLRPCVWAISELVGNYKCTAVLCTATRPSLDRLVKEFYGKNPEELRSDTEEDYRFFRRTTYKDEGLVGEDDLAEALSAEKQVLCIVNSRKQAQRIFGKIKSEGAFHLSTAMTPSHRSAVVSEIGKRLKSGENCRVISTCLIEAGVDVDFPCVYKALSGLDSIIQAGGRCNREGKRPTEKSVVHVFRTEEKNPPGLGQNIDAAEKIVREYEDISSPEAIKAYFDYLLYRLKGEELLDKKRIMECVSGFRFREVSEKFKIIDKKGITVYIPDRKAEELLKRLELFGPDRALTRKLGRFSVSVYDYHYKKLENLGAVRRLSEDTAVLTAMNYYDEDTGILLDPEGGEAYMI